VYFLKILFVQHQCKQYFYSCTIGKRIETKCCLEIIDTKYMAILWYYYGHIHGPCYIGSLFNLNILFENCIYFLRVYCGSYGA